MQSFFQLLQGCHIVFISHQTLSKLEKCYEVRQELKRQIDSNLWVLQWALLLVLCLCFSTQFLLFNLHFGFWDAYNPYLHKMGKNVQHLFKENCHVQPYIKFFVGDDFFFPSVVIIGLVLHFLDPLYKSCLQIKSKS